MPAAQGILTYIANRTLPYHLYADESGLLVLAALLTSASLSKNKFFDRLQKAHPSGWAFLLVSAFRPGELEDLKYNMPVGAAVYLRILEYKKPA